MRPESALDSRRRDADRRRSRQIAWQLRLTSLWAPLVVFLCAFVPYVVWTQFRLQDAQWLHPLLQGFGLLMVAAFLGLLVARLSMRRFSRMRHLRVEVSALVIQLGREIRRVGAISKNGRDRLLELLVALEERRLGREPEALEQAITQLQEWGDKTVPGWRRHASLDAFMRLLLTLLAIFSLRTLIVEPYQIPSGSMLPTLQINDHVLVNRFIYGLRIPLVNVVPFPIVRRPARGDVIVFNNPLDTSKDFIKRVAGIPGDKVEIVGEVLHVNGVPQPRRLVEEGLVVHDVDHFVVHDLANDKYTDTYQWATREVTCYEEQLGGVAHATLQSPFHPRGHLTEGPWTVPDGQVFVLGDNRDNSADSRAGFGVRNGVAFVPYGNIKGKAMVIWLSLSYGGLFSGLFGNEAGLRTDRLFLPVR